MKITYETQPSRQKVNKTYTSNEQFWRDALDKEHFQSMQVRLQGFHLTEWIPSAPGRFYTSDGLRSRALAEQYLRDGTNEYTMPSRFLCSDKQQKSSNVVKASNSAKVSRLRGTCDLQHILRRWHTHHVRQHLEPC